jgi:hypothetical protein
MASMGSQRFMERYPGKFIHGQELRRYVYFVNTGWTVLSKQIAIDLVLIRVDSDHRTIHHGYMMSCQIPKTK